MTMSRVSFIITLLLALVIMYQLMERRLNKTIEHKLQGIELIHQLPPSAESHELAARQTWGQIQTKAKDAVVQVFAQRAEFNWIEPYIPPAQSQTCGTAFFIDDKGRLITNAHVVASSRSLWIQLPSLGKRIIDVEVTGFCPERDLAQLQVTESGMAIIKEIIGDIPYLELGDSNTVHRADEVLALGYPLSQHSLKSTTGVVSGREHIGQYYIQIDAPINPGNSGGPCLNERGQVIGINAANIPSAQNVGYVIPINELRIILDDLPKQPLLRKPFMGVMFVNASDSLTAYLGNPPPGGCFVTETYKGSPLDKAGIKPFDMIYSINGIAIDIFGDMNVVWSEDKLSLMDYVASLPAESPIELVVYRYGKRHTFNFSLDQTELLPIRVMYPDYEPISYEIIGGMVIMQLTVNHILGMQALVPQLGKYLEIKHQQEPALLITHIHPSSLGHRTRAIKIGSVIEEINGTPVTTLEQLRNIVAKTDRKGFVTIKSTSGAFVAFPFAQMLFDELRLSFDYKYPITPFIKDLLSQLQDQKPFTPPSSGQNIPVPVGAVVPA